MIRCCTWITSKSRVDYPSEVMPDYSLNAFPYYKDEYDIPDLIDENPPVTTARYFKPQIAIAGTCLQPTKSRWHEAICSYNRQLRGQEVIERNEAILARVEGGARKDDMVDIDPDEL